MHAARAAISQARADFAKICERLKIGALVIKHIARISYRQVAPEGARLRTG
jgi:hypothetical protein